MSIRTEAQRLQNNEINVEMFLKNTLKEWRKIANSLLSRWAAPVEIEDVLQDICLAIVELLPLFDKSRGVSLGDYLIFNASDKAKKRIHKYRGANIHRGADRNASRLPVLYEPDVISNWASYSEKPEQENKVILSQFVDKFSDPLTKKVAFIILKTDVEAATKTVFEDHELRASFRLNTREQARELTGYVFGWIKIIARSDMAALWLTSTKQWPERTD